MLLQKRIFEWSKDLPLWQSDLLRRLTSGPLDDTGRRQVMRILAGAADAPAPAPLELAALPADEGEHGRVELRAIRDLHNINCLASGQSLRLAPGAQRRLRRQRLGQEWLRTTDAPGHPVRRA